MGAPYAVQLTLPALADSARLARLVAAALATDAGWTIDDTEDLRVAVSELVALLIDGAEDADTGVDLSYVRTADVVEVSGRRPLSGVDPASKHLGDDGTPAPTPDDLALEILRVVVDDHEFVEDATGRWFRLVKQSRPRP